MDPETGQATAQRGAGQAEGARGRRQVAPARRQGGLQRTPRAVFIGGHGRGEPTGRSAQGPGDLRAAEALTRRQDEEPLQDVLELAHVAGPGLGGEHLESRRRQSGRLGSVSRGQAPQHRADQPRQVGGPLAQAGHAHADHVEPVQQIGAKAPAAHGLLQIALGRRDDPGAEADRAARAESLELAILEHAQQASLERQGQLADLVQEQRPRAGSLEAPDPAQRSAREGAALVPEQLALEQGGGQGRAVEVHEGAIAARGAVVKPARQQPLADAGLAEQEHAGVEGCHARELSQRGAHGRTLGDQVGCLGHGPQTAAARRGSSRAVWDRGRREAKRFARKCRKASNRGEATPPSERGRAALGPGATVPGRPRRSRCRP